MPDTRNHRGPHPDDLRLFAPDALARLCQATSDLCWLLDRGYAANSSLKLVGDRHGLVARQRIAVGRSACCQSDRSRREEHRLEAPAVVGRPLWLDGYNVLTTIEAALAGGIVLEATDGCYRDMASMHGSYRKVAETEPALEILGETLAELHPSECRWYLDRPVSNSGRLAGIIRQVAAGHDWAWHVELVPDPDPLLAQSDQIVATADSLILDCCRGWFNLARAAIDSRLAQVDVARLV